jgi:RND family efflux transporter MFP subunit
MPSPSARRIPRWLTPTLILTLVLSGALGWALRRSPDSPEDAAVDPPAGAAGQTAAREVKAPVEAVHVRRSDLSLRAEATGYIEPWRQVDIKAEAGGRVIERTVENGATAGAGALLVRIDDRDHLIELEDARAEWLKTQATYAVDFDTAGATRTGPQKAAPEEASEEVRKAEMLLREGLISKRDMAEVRRRDESRQILAGSRKDEIRAASRGVTQAEQRIERARLALDRTRIRAPFAGRAADVAIEIGQQIAPGERLLSLLEVDRVKVDVNVLEADMVRLRPGAPARVHIPSLDNLDLQGTLYTINPRINPETGSGQVTVAIPNPRGLLLTGLFANVQIETRRVTGRLVVPASALLSRQGRDLVFRIENGRVLWTYVKVGARSGDQVEITDGLAEGDLVATGGHFALAHEAPVQVQLADRPAAGTR